MRAKRLTENEINYNVLNGLNLYNEELGEEYLAGGFNPLGENFILTEAYILERLANKMELPKETISPQFLEAGVKETRLAFLNSLTNCKTLLEKIEEMLNDPHIPEHEKEKLRKLKLYLILRIQLLTKYTKTIKKDKNTLKMYENLEGLHYRLGKKMAKTYLDIPQFNSLNILELIKESMQAVEDLSKLIEAQNNNLQNKAKEILKEGTQNIKEAVQETKEAAKEVVKEAKEVTKKASKQIEKVVAAPIDAIKDIVKEPEPVAEEYKSTTKVSVKRSFETTTTTKKHTTTKKQTTKQNDELSR